MNTPARPISAATITRTGDLWTLVPAHPGGEVLVVNHTGYQIISRCDGTHTSSDIARELAHITTGLAAEDLAADVTGFIDRLAAARLLAD